MRKLDIDMEYVQRVLLELLAVPSPTGYTDMVVHLVARELESMDIPFELTRRGAIRADLKGEHSSPDRAVVAHLDTLGAMVRSLEPNGRCRLAPIGHWSARFAEGGRVTVFTEGSTVRGTVLPLKASGHRYNEEVDTQPTGWDHVELRIDVNASDPEELEAAGVQIGDYVAFDTAPEVVDTGYVVSRHLDDKAGVAALLGAARAVTRSLGKGEAGCSLPVDCHLLFTISEEVGSGASAGLHGDVAELVSVDNAVPAPGQNSRETGVTVAMMDMSGPFDYHLTQKLLRLCREHEIDHQRDLFRYYRTDAAAAVEAGNDLRTALICFGVDASHGYERTHLSAIESLAQLLAVYMQSQPTFTRDSQPMNTISGFPRLPGADLP